MPNCFQLTRKTELDKGPVGLNTIDAELCGVLGREVHPTCYVRGWFDYIGWKLAMGSSFQEIREHIQGMLDDMAEDGSGEQDVASVNHASDMLKLCNYLDANFTSDAWAEIGKR